MGKIAREKDDKRLVLLKAVFTLLLSTGVCVCVCVCVCAYLIVFSQD